MKKGLFDLLKGKFLVSDDAPKNWRFIVFVSLLATVMIGSSHGVDKKVHEIASMNEEVKELRSEFLSLHKEVQRLKLESKVASTLEPKGMFPSETPPKKIMVKSE